MVEFLKLPPKLKLFGKMDSLRKKVKTEAEAVKEGWEERDRSERIAEGEVPISND